MARISSQVLARSRRRPLRASPAGALVAWLLCGAALGSASEIRDLDVAASPAGWRVSLRLVDAFSDEVEGRLQSGLEVAFEYTLRLRRKRGGFGDKTVSERYVVVAAQYSNLTKMFKVTRRIDGTVTDSDVTDDPEVMKEWMTRLEGLPLFDGRDFDRSGTYYLRVKAKLMHGFRMLFIPWDVETDWSESPAIRVDEVGW
jgi:hypothetical protein